jgi:hypothetical protein
MNTHADKTQENKSRTAANAVSQKQSGAESTFQFVDIRPEAIVQQKLQKMANNSPQAKKAAQLQSMANHNSAKQQQSAQETENNTGLPDNLKSGIENLSGYSMGDVKVHYNSDKPAQLQAHAYAQGTDIHLASGQEKHLPHEAWHVVQQKQGRVQSTMQMKGKVNINDDAGLEKEADVMGQKAMQHAAIPDHVNPTHQLAPNKNAVIQCIMSVAEFQSLTPGTALIKPRKTVDAIDVALGTYIGAKTIANIANLIGVIQHYVGGNHDANRIAVANQLLIRAQAESDLIQEIGNGNSFLIDGLIEQAGIANIANLVTLANTATVVHAPHLSALITAAGGAGGIVNLNTLIGHVGVANIPYLAGVILSVGGFANRAHITNLVAETGQANFMNIPSYIHLSGGVANIASLIALLNRNTGNPDRASQFLAAANGNAARFTNMFNLLPIVTNAGAPANATVNDVTVKGHYPNPSNLMGQYTHYSERHRAQNFIFDYRNINMPDGQTLWPYPGTSSANIQTYLETVLVNPIVQGGRPAGPPVPGAYANVPVGVGGMQARIRINNPTGVNNFRISQFFPENGTPGTAHFSGLEMVGVGMVMGWM